jgi:hypothetical protein
MLAVRAILREAHWHYFGTSHLPAKVDILCKLLISLVPAEGLEPPTP